MSKAWDEFTAAHERYDSAHQAFLQLCRDVIAGTEFLPREDGLKMAAEAKQLHAEFMKAAEPICRGK